MAHSFSLETVRQELARVLALAPAPSPRPAAAEGQLGRWLELLVDWNTRMDLTAARSEGELCDLMLADALVLAARVPRDATVIDVGTGAGAPGLPLALLRSDLRVTLVEPLAKRVAFLRAFLGEATPGLAEVRLEKARGEKMRGTWDVAVSRATLAPPVWLPLGASLVNDAGSVWVLLAKGEPPVHVGMRVAEDVPYTWPLTGMVRRAVRYAKGPPPPP